MNKKIFVSIAAVLVNLFLAMGKIFVGLFMGVVSIFADGINSGTDVIASLIGYIGIKAAEKPADREHPYGHGKAEVISGFVIMVIILLSAIFIIYDAIRSFFVETESFLGIIAFVVMGISALINGVMSQIKIYYGKKYESYSLISDGIHSRIDLLVSLGVFIGLFLIKIYPKADSIIALLVGIYVFREALKLGKETTDSLLGISAGEEIENKIKSIAKEEKIDIEDLKTQKRGSSITANIEIKLPSKIHVEKASQISEKLKNHLVNEIRNLEYVAIQINSHDFKENYFIPASGIGKGFGWQRKGKFKEILEEAQGKGPDGHCVCSKCGYKQEHERGTPCSTIKCPNCKINLRRE
jgi:cation diffusion facilitator family transporter